MNQTNSQQAAPEQPAHKVVNGVDVDVLGGTVGAIQADPGMGACRFRASNSWVDGAQNCSRVTGFYGAHQEIAHKQAFEMLADEPAILAGSDDGANPVEYLLHALASCLTTSMIAHAAVRGIKIEAMQSELEGDLDLNGFLGLNHQYPCTLPRQGGAGRHANDSIAGRVLARVQHADPGRRGKRRVR